MKKFTKKAKAEIQKFIKNNQPRMDWNSSDFDKDSIIALLQNGFEKSMDELYEYNLDYIFELESYLIKEIQEQWDEYDEDEIEEFSRDFISVDMDYDNILSNFPDITCVAYVYSNYDCCNSFDKLEPESYLGEVYKRVKVGVRKSDYMHEFYNGAYGGALFCFVFNTDIETALELIEKEKTGKTITIPKGTQFGFFSSFQGAGTPFEKTTYRNMTLPLVGDTEYDSINIIPDICQSYNMTDLYGDTSFVQNANITIK